jgi:hypothetical protein
MTRLALLFVLVALLAGCQGPGEPVLDTGINRWVDPDYRIMCWTIRVYGGSSISCLPESQVVHR